MRIIVGPLACRSSSTFSSAMAVEASDRHPPSCRNCAKICGPLWTSGRGAMEASTELSAERMLRETGDVKLRDFISVVRSFRTGLSDSDLKQVFMRFDSGRSGTIDYMRFEDFIVMGGTDGNFGYGGSSDAKLLTDVMRKLKSIFSRRTSQDWRSVFADLADREPDIDLRDFGGILEDELRSEGSERGRKLCKKNEPRRMGHHSLTRSPSHGASGVVTHRDFTRGIQRDFVPPQSVRGFGAARQRSDNS